MRKIIDITRELFSCPSYPGDPAPHREQFTTIDKSGYSLTTMFACVHNGTHIDAPAHFIENGGDVTEIELSSCIGDCVVVGNIDDAIAFAERGIKRVLLKDCDLTEMDAKRLSDCVRLLGMNAPSFGEKTNSTKAVHLALLSKKVILLENLDLSEVKTNKLYELIALPLKLKGCEGSPVRAVLIDNE